MFSALEPDPEMPESEIMFPGEPESRVKTKREKGGIQIDEGTWDAIREQAKQLSVKHFLLSK